jgi:hypothetical protein
LIANYVFEDNSEDGLSFASWAGCYTSLRIFYSGEKIENFLTYDAWKALINSDQFPGRFHHMIDNTYIPSSEEVEEASGRLFN